MKVSTIIMCFCIAAAMISCKKDVVGNGPVSTQTRTLSNFSAIDLQMNGNVYYKNDPQWKVEITAKESIHAMLETRMVDKKLVLRFNNGKTYDADESIRINIAGPGVNSFTLNSSGSIFMVNAIHADQLFLRTSGSGNIWLQQVTAANIDAESKTSGRIAASGGTALHEKIKTDGSGKIDLSAIAARNVNARVVGSGDIKVNVSDKLEARIDGSGSIYFSGSPLLTTDINGTGKLIRF